MEGSLYIRWVMSQQNVDTDIKVDQAKVDAKVREIMSDPRMKPVTVVSVQQVDLPVEGSAGAMQQQLMYARAVEAQQIMQRYKGCRPARRARTFSTSRSAGPSRPISTGCPRSLRKALLEAGTRKLIGPIPGPTGVRLFANCGTRKISPPRAGPAADRGSRAQRAVRGPGAAGNGGSPQGKLRRLQGPGVQALGGPGRSNSTLAAA